MLITEMQQQKMNYANKDQRLTREEEARLLRTIKSLLPGFAICVVCQTVSR